MEDPVGGNSYLASGRPLRRLRGLLPLEDDLSEHPSLQGMTVGFSWKSEFYPNVNHQRIGLMPIPAD